MYYFQLRSPLPIPNKEILASIHKSEHAVETTVGHVLQSPDEVDSAINVVGPWLNQFDPMIVDQMTVTGIGVQLFLPINRTVNQFLESCLPICDEITDTKVGFKGQHTNLFFAPTLNDFKTLPKRQLSRWIKVDFVCLKPENSFLMPLYANYLRSRMLWSDLHQYLIDHLESIDSKGMGVFDQVRREIVAGIRVRIKDLQETVTS